jgi:DNA-binding NarL/FixJ family response regulator
MSIRVLLVDDEQVIRAGLRVIVDAEPDLEVVGQADDGTEGPCPVARSRPDVVLMDVRMPSVDGVRAAGHLISTMDWTPKIIMVTMFEKDDYVYDALRAGGSAADNANSAGRDRLARAAFTERVREVFRLVASGLSNVDTGGEFFLGIQTVKDARGQRAGETRCP